MTELQEENCLSNYLHKFGRWISHVGTITTKKILFLSRKEKINVNNITEKRGVEVSEQIIRDLPTYAVVQSDIPDLLFSEILMKANIRSAHMMLKVKINNTYGINLIMLSRHLSNYIANT